MPRLSWRYSNVSRYSVNTITPLTAAAGPEALQPASESGELTVVRRRDRLDLLQQRGDQPLFLPEVLIGQVRRHSGQGKIFGVEEIRLGQRDVAPELTHDLVALPSGVVDRGHAQVLGPPTQAQPQRGWARQRPLPQHLKRERLHVIGLGVPQRTQHPLAMPTQPAMDFFSRLVGCTSIGRGGCRRLIGCGGLPRATSSLSRRTMNGRTTSGSSRPSSAARCGDSSWSRLANDSW